MGGQGSRASRGSVAPYFRTSTPEAGAPGLGLFAQPLELAAVGVGEGARASQSQLDQLLVEETLVLPVTVDVQVDIGKGSLV